MTKAHLLNRHSASAASAATALDADANTNAASTVTAAPRIFGIAGRSGSGKTTLIETMLPLLAARGLRGEEEPSLQAQVARLAPADYQAVHDVFRELHIGPYAGTAPMTLGDVVRKYWAFGVAGPGRESGVARTGGSAGRPPLYVNALLPLK